MKKRKRAEKAERKRQTAEARARTILAGEAKPRPVGRRGALGPRGARGLAGAVLEAECTGRARGAERGDIRASLFCERLKAVGEVVVGEAEEVGWDGDLVGSFGVDWGGDGSALPAVYAGMRSCLVSRDVVPRLGGLLRVLVKETSRVYDVCRRLKSWWGLTETSQGDFFTREGW